MGDTPTTTIQVSAHTRDRLRQLAAEQGRTMGELIEDYAETTLTAAELEARGREAEQFVAEHRGHPVTEAERQAGRDLWQRIAEHQGRRS